MSGFILIFFDDSTELAGESLPVGKQTRTDPPTTVRVAPLPQSVKAEVSDQAGQWDGDTTLAGGSADKSTGVISLKTVNLRPDCLKPDMCSGYGAHQCHACTKAAGELA